MTGFDIIDGDIKLSKPVFPMNFGTNYIKFM